MSFEARLASWTRDVCDAALILLVALCLLTIALGRVLPLTGRTTLAVAGGSMEPAIHLGSAIVVEPVDPRSLAVGDVVSLRSGPERAIFSHRIIRVVVRDGHCLDRDQGRRQRPARPSLTPASQVIGRASATIPMAGYLIALLSSLHGIVFVVSLGLVLILTASLVDRPSATPERSRQAEPASRTAPDPT